MDFDPDDTFDPFDAPGVCREYVCGTCHSELAQIYLPGERRVLVICPEHGTVTKCGRVMRSTVDIEMERSYRKFLPAVKALPDLWGVLIPARKTSTQLLSELGF